MFEPSQHDVRRFFCQTWHKLKASMPLDPMQTLAAAWIREHPEYDTALADEEAALAAHYPIEQGHTNPFLHLSMHLSIAEQVAIDQPSGIRAAVQALTQRHDSLHEAHHAVMECLGLMIWESQRSGRPPDGLAYVEAVKRLSTPR
jgi:hypothetical protein